MTFSMNLILMKRLLRQGWVRVGVPLSSIESLADHSWSVAILTYILGFQENQLRESNKPRINIEKALLKALFHDLSESEYFDIDKSVNKILSPEKLIQFQNDLEKGALKNLITKFPTSMTSLLKELMEDHESEEYHLVRAADLIDLLIQANEYWNKRWINEHQHKNFETHAMTQLKEYQQRFISLQELLKEINR